MPTRPVRVLHLRDSAWVDGPGRTIIETAAHVDRGRVDLQIGVFVSDDANAHPMIVEARTKGLRIHAIADRPGLDCAMIRQVNALIEELEIDVLHTSEFRSNALSLFCRSSRPLKKVTTVHGWIANDWRGRVYRLLDKLLLRSFDAIIVVSNATRRLVWRHWLPESRTTVLHNALVLGSYGARTRSTPRRPVHADGPIRIVNIGRLSAEKGQNLLLQAVAPLMASHQGLRLKFAGIGPLEAELRATAAELGIASRVDFLGYVRNMDDLYSNADLVVQSSLTEGLPNVILEAAYLNVPIVATAVGGTSEIVQHDHSGWLVRPGSASEIQDGIREFLAKPDYFAGLAERAHAAITSRFSFEARTRALTQIYEGLFYRQ